MKAPHPDEVDFGRATVQVDDARAAAAFRRERRAVQVAELARVTDEFGAVVRLPWQPVADLGPADIADLAAALTVPESPS